MTHPLKASIRSARLLRCCSCLKLPDGTVKVLVEGGSRAQILSYTERTDFP